MEISEGKPYPLGATADEKGANFAVFSANATRVEVCIFDSDGTTRDRTLRAARAHRRSVPRPCRRAWGPATFYGFRVHGPYRARGWPPLQSQQASARPLRARPRRQADLGPRGVRLHDRREGRRPDLRQARQRAFRAEIRHRRSEFRLARRIPAPQRPVGTTPSSTRRMSRASPSCIRRSTRSSAASTPGSARSPSSTTSSRSASRPSSSCRSTPSSTTTTCSRRASRTIGATIRSASSRRTRAMRPTCPNSLREFKEMIARLHDGGLEVILDVVYNHTAEGNERGPTLSFKGIDNRSYYRLMPDQPRYYINDTGTGNTLNLSHPRVIQMVADCLRYWVTRDAGRRIPLRSRHDPRARARRLQDRERLSQGGRTGPAARGGQADRRALGLRAGRLPGRRLSAGLGGMERHVPRRRARLLARPRRARRRSRRVFAPRPTSSTFAAESPGRASISSPPTTASPCAISSPTTTSTTRRTARTIATATPTTAHGTAAPRGRPTTRRSRPCAGVRSAICSRR